MPNQLASWTPEVWQFHTANILAEIGSGLITPSPYDTAWVARLIDQDHDLGASALEWLCTHQLPDGSWGAAAPICYHDRIISTLAAMTTIARYGRRAHDHNLIVNGQAALEEMTRSATSKLMANPAGATVGFEMIAPTLVTEAEELGLLASQGDRIMGRLEKQRKLKLAKLADRRIDRRITAAFSLEMVGNDLSRIDVDNLQETNGSIAFSPSATAFYLLKVRPGDPAALDYLHRVRLDGSVPYVAPLDIFEAAWSLWNLALTEWSQPLKDSCKKHIETIKGGWRNGVGAATATGLTLVDGDDSAIAYEAMLHWGHRVSMDSLLGYEAETGFLCFRLEVDPSTSTNIHLLSAFRAGGYETKHPAVQKILNFLLHRQAPDGMWVDKWHLSAYYPTSHAIIACAGYKDELVEKAVRRILQNQNNDGSWGANLPTAEETAYALQALCAWKRHGHDVDAGVLFSGANWLNDHMEDPCPPLWIGKSLYSPIRVVKITLLSALGMVLQELGGKS
jgi:halimadienyl-diphosphate synthase